MIIPAFTREYVLYLNDNAPLELLYSIHPKIEWNQLPQASVSSELPTVDELAREIQECRELDDDARELHEYLERFNRLDQCVYEPLRERLGIPPEIYWKGGLEFFVNRVKDGPEDLTMTRQQWLREWKGLVQAHESVGKEGSEERELSSYTPAALDRISRKIIFKKVACALSIRHLRHFQGLVEFKRLMADH